MRASVLKNTFIFIHYTNSFTLLKVFSIFVYRYLNIYLKILLFFCKKDCKKLGDIVKL